MRRAGAKILTEPTDHLYGERQYDAAKRQDVEDRIQKIDNQPSKGGGGRGRDEFRHGRGLR